MKVKNSNKTKKSNWVGGYLIYKAVVVTPRAIEQRWKWRKPLLVASEREEEKQETKVKDEAALFKRGRNMCLFNQVCLAFFIGIWSWLYILILTVYFDLMDDIISSHLSFKLLLSLIYIYIYIYIYREREREREREW